MKIDLNKGINLKIEGELGKYQTLSVDALVSIAQTLQELVLSIAKNDLSTNETVDLNNFKIELSNFKKGSAIPQFEFSQRIQTTTFSDYKEQQNEVSKRLNDILEVSDKGDYSKLIQLYPEYSKRNEIVDRLYNFTSSFKNSPVSLYENGQEENLSIAYKLKKFKQSTKNELLVKIIPLETETFEQNAYAKIKVTTKGSKKTNKIELLISDSKHSLAYSPEIINVNSKQYILNYPLRCLFEQEDDFYTIHNEQLGIIGTGITEDEAELNFNEEFDYLYVKLNSLNDSQLSNKLIRIKSALNSFIKHVY